MPSFDGPSAQHDSKGTELAAVALLVVWNSQWRSALCALAGHALDFQFWPAGMVWVVLGLISMLRDPVDAPVLDGTYVDVVGALRMQWWAVGWPMRVSER